MSEPFYGEIRMVGFKFAPRGWALCDGQQLPINQNQALWTLLGTSFGGDGKVNFNLPDMRGRTPMNVGTLGNNSVNWGQGGGEEMHTLTVAEMPGHTHTPLASSAGPTAANPSGNWWANNVSQYSSSMETGLATNAIGMNAGGQGHENRSPYLVINFVIALTGIYPSRN